MPRSLSRNSFRFLLAFICIALLAFDSTTAWSQRRTTARSSASAVMGRGIHSYFSGQSAEADRQLTAVINAGSRDARAYYFRGLARLQQGRQYEAEQDMQLGAALEARNPGSARGISQSLMRVQGANRRTLEKFRREGRLTATQTMTQEVVARSQQLNSRESYVLRKPVQVPVENLLDSSGIQIITPDTHVMPGSYVESAPRIIAPATQPSTEEIPAQAAQTPAEVLAPSETRPAAVAATESVATPQPELAAEAPLAEAESFDELFETPAEPTTNAEPTPAPEPAADPDPVSDFFSEEPSEPAQPAEVEMESESPAAPEAADDLFETEPAEAEAPAESLFEQPVEAAEPVESTPDEPAMEPEAEETGAIDDLFSSEPEESAAEESTPDEATELATSEEEMTTEEMPEEETATDDLFELEESTAEEPADEAPPEQAPTAEASLPKQSKVGSKTLLGILGRAAGGMVPKPDVSISEIVPPLSPGAGAPPATADDFELGPEDAFSPSEELPPAPPSSEPKEAPPATVDELFELEEETSPMTDDADEGVDLFDELEESPTVEAAEEVADEGEAAEDTPAETQPSEAASEETAPAEETSEEEMADEEVAEEETSSDEASQDSAEEESVEEESAEEESVEEESADEDEETDDDPFDLFD